MKSNEIHFKGNSINKLNHKEKETSRNFRFGKKRKKAMNEKEMVQE
jgi:hypothetical protein